MPRTRPRMRLLTSTAGFVGDRATTMSPNWSCCANRKAHQKHIKRLFIERIWAYREASGQLLDEHKIALRIQRRKHRRAQALFTQLFNKSAQKHSINKYMRTLVSSKKYS